MIEQPKPLSKIERVLDHVDAALEVLRLIDDDDDPEIGLGKYEDPLWLHIIAAKSILEEK